MKSKNINNIYTSTAKQFLPGIYQLFGKRPDINLPEMTGPIIIQNQREYTFGI